MLDSNDSPSDAWAGWAEGLLRTGTDKGVCSAGARGGAGVTAGAQSGLGMAGMSVTVQRLDGVTQGEQGEGSDAAASAFGRQQQEASSSGQGQGQTQVLGQRQGQGQGEVRHRGWWKACGPDHPAMPGVPASWFEGLPR